MIVASSLRRAAEEHTLRVRNTMYTLYQHLISFEYRDKPVDVFVGESVHHVVIPAAGSVHPEDDVRYYGDR